MKKALKFWQKLYLATLALFLASLFGGLFAVAQISCNLSFEARRDEFLSRQHVMAQYMAEDISAVLASRPDALNDLLTTHAQRYAREGLSIAVWRGEGEVLFSNQPEVPEGRAELATLQPGRRTWQVRVLDGRHVIFATTALSGDLEGYLVGASCDIEDFFAQWNSIAALFWVLSAIVSVVFALALFVVLGRMSRPLNHLTLAARAMAVGDYSVRATGKRPRRDELGELGRTLDDLADRVQNQLGELAAEAEAKQTLVDNLSHEMRTPLTAIGGYAEYIQRADLDRDELAEATETIRFESTRLLNLSNQLVRLSVLRNEPLELIPVDAALLLRSSARAVAPKASRRHVRVRVELPGGPEGPMLMGDEDLLESLLVNLCDNGIKACSKSGTVNRITLRAEAGPDGGARITVTDTGRGMDAETLARIGQPFYRADKARSRAEGGAGLGVALCKAIVEAHGATLRYASEVGRGTMAQVVFPPAQPQTREDETEP